MLESSKDRIKLLKAGVSGKKIEQMYLDSNDFKILNKPLLFEFVYIKSDRQNIFLKDK